jgi:hypothetical protein
MFKLTINWSVAVSVSIFSCKSEKRDTVKPQFIVSFGGPEKEQWIRENDRCYIKWIKSVKFAYVYLLNQKTYTNGIISTVKSNMHYLFLKKSLIHICLAAPFFFKLNNNLSILTTFAFSYGDVVTIHERSHWLKQYASKQKKKKHEALQRIEYRWLTVYCTMQERELIHTNDINGCQRSPGPPSPQDAVWFVRRAQGHITHM